MAIDLAAWYGKYGPMVIRRCRSMLGSEDEAMDAAQDVFFNLLKSEGRLSASFPSSLLYTMATNVCLNRLRSKKRDKAAGEIEGLSVIDTGYDQVDARLLMDTILEDESEESRAIFFMYYADGMSLREIGETVGLSISGVRKRIMAFIKRARLKLGEDTE